MTGDSSVPTTTSIKVSALGQTVISVDGLPVQANVPAKAAALFVYLVDSGGAASRSRLAGLFWSDQPEDRARANLRIALTRLRRHVGAHLDTDRRTVRIAGTVSYDVDQMVADPRLATELYHGDFLAGVEFDDAPLFDDWLVARRAALRHAAVEGLIRAIGGFEAAGEWERCISSADSIIGIDPVEERAHRASIRAHLQLNGRGAALARFNVCVEQIDRELGLEPEPETLELAREIESGASGGSLDRPLVTTVEPALNDEHHDRLIVPPTPFFGRQHELELVHNLLVDGARSVTLVGPGGVGKTRLAERLIDRARGDFDRLVVVELHGVTDPERVVATIASAFGVSASDPLDELAAEIADERVLLVLDNADEVASATGQFVSSLLATSPGLSVIATSRRVLGVSVEHVVSVDGLGRGNSPDDHSDVDMFIERARRFDPEVAVDDDVRRICAALGGLPLAIELAARWSGAMAIADIAEQLSTGVTMLETDASDVPDRHRSMQRVLDMTWMGLATDDQRRLASLSVFRSGFTARSAHAVADASPAHLQHLANRSLLRRVPGGRFAMHELVRQFAAAQLTDDERALVAARHADALLAQLARSEPELFGESAAQAVSRLSADFDNLVAAWSLCVETGAVDRLTAVAAPLSMFAVAATRDIEAAELLRRAARSSAGRARGCMLAYELVTSWRRQPIEASKGLYERAQAALGNGSDSINWRLVAVNAYATALTEQAGNAAEALRLAQEVLSTASELSDQYLRAELELTCGRALGVSGRFSESERTLETALERFEELGNSWGVADAVGLLAATHAEQYHVWKAMIADRRALALWTSRRDEQATCTGHANLGSSYVLVGAWDTAERHTAVALQMAQEQTDPLFTAYLHCQLAEIAIGRGHEDIAETEFLAGIGGLRSEQYMIGLRLKLPEWGRLLVNQQRWVEADLVLDEAMGVCDKIGGDHFVITVDAVKARLLVESGRTDEGSALAANLWQRISACSGRGLPQPVVSMADCASAFELLGEMDQAAAVRSLARKVVRDVVDSIGEPEYRQTYLAMPLIADLLNDNDRRISTR